MRRAHRSVVAVLSLLLLAGCGLPLPDGVRSAGDVGAAAPDAAGLQLLPPGPQPGASAEQLVNGFLAAQVSPQDDYAIARQFLTPGNLWKPIGSVKLYTAGSQQAVPDAEVARGLKVSFRQVATIDQDGRYAPERRRVDDGTYVVTPDRASGQLRLSVVPDGLRLIDSDLDRSYRAREVYYLGRTGAGGGSRLVADRVFQPLAAEPAKALVTALLAGPTTALVAAGNTPNRPGAVETAVPSGTKARDVRTDAGIVTVDLSGEVLGLAALERQRMSAQFVWTLVPTYRGVRLLADGKPFEVPGAKPVQDRQDWPGYDPSGLGSDVPLLFIADRRLDSLDGELASSDVTSGGRIGVDAAALSPGRGTLAVLTDMKKHGTDEVRIGPLPGPFGAAAFRKPDLTSPSWGSGERGLWLLQTGSASIIWLLPERSGASRSPPLAVSYKRPPREAGKLSAIAVSRDGARIAMLFGEEGADRRLYVGRIQPSPAGFEVAVVTSIAPELSTITDVAWASGTSVVVLAQRDNRPSVLAFSVAVDGSEVTPVNTTGLPTTGLVSVAAAPDRPLVVGVQTADGRVQLYREGNGQFVQQDVAGREPFYPG